MYTCCNTQSKKQPMNEQQVSGESTAFKIFILIYCGRKAGEE